MHPFGACPGGGCHDRDIRGTGLLSQVIERGRSRLMRLRELARGLATRPGWWCSPRRCWPRRAGGRRGSAACGRSPWWRSSCRAAARCSGSRPRSQGGAWRSARPRTRSTGPRPSLAYLCTQPASTGPQALAGAADGAVLGPGLLPGSGWDGPGSRAGRRPVAQRRAAPLSRGRAHAARWGGRGGAGEGSHDCCPFSAGWSGPAGGAPRLI